MGHSILLVPVLINRDDQTDTEGRTKADWQIDRRLDGDGETDRRLDGADRTSVAGRQTGGDGPTNRRIDGRI